VRTIAREGVQNTHHLSKRTETTTENRVGQLGLKRWAMSIVIAEAIRHCRRW